MEFIKDKCSNIYSIVFVTLTLEVFLAVLNRYLTPGTKDLRISIISSQPSLSFLIHRFLVSPVFSLSKYTVTIKKDFFFK